MKLKPVEYHPGARLEAIDAFKWYELHESGLGDRFQAALSDTETFVRQNPQLGTPHTFGTRKRRLKIFPYILIYSEEPTAILILAVAHVSRRSSYWHSRIQG